MIHILERSLLTIVIRIVWFGAGGMGQSNVERIGGDYSGPDYKPELGYRGLRWKGEDGQRLVA